ncbi:AAR2 protein-domain-containing protein [Podospora fimiseda]|uniref:AAR2 protein-domain-containing protein n=1 Tax=Podospora fimiseda TaxID=252190 RepID=A0AAN7BZ10_9PEZI|nr:AAR2 protein-domain-containing protein [Podospora fimiseda]
METPDLHHQHQQDNTAAHSNGSPTIDYFTLGTGGVKRNTSVRSRVSFDPSESGGNDADLLLSPTFSDAPTSPSHTPSLYGTLHKSNSGKLSIKSARSVRVTGSHPLGQLRVHRPESIDSTLSDKKKQCYECLRKGDVFRIIDLPDDFVVGLDGMAMTTSKSLAGFRDIPQGAHFLWVQQPGQISRSGYWFVTDNMPGQIRMKQWDKYNEVLGPVVSKVEDQAERQDMESRYLEMKPYTLNDAVGNNSSSDWTSTPTGVWRTMTNAISTRYLVRVTSNRHTQEFHVDTMDCVWGEFRHSTTKNLTGVSCEFKFITSQIFQDLRALNGTAHVTMDTAPNVLGLLQSDPELTEEDIIAELQFSFVMGTYLTNHACLEQWWEMVLKIVIRATGLVGPRPSLLKGLVQTLWAQMLFTEEHVKPENEDGGVMMSSCCGGPNSDRTPYTFKTQMKGKLLKGLVSCEKALAREFAGKDGRKMTHDEAELIAVWDDFAGWLRSVGWDLGKSIGRDIEKLVGREGGEAEDDSEDEDDQPVIVDLDEDGREVGLVSFH